MLIVVLGKPFFLFLYRNRGRCPNNVTAFYSVVIVTFLLTTYENVFNNNGLVFPFSVNHSFIIAF